MRRQHRNNFGSGASDTAALMARLAGSSSPTTVIPAFYDRRRNVAVSGGVVTTIDDVRGAAGFGPQIVFAGTARPAYTAATQIVTFDGTDDYGETALVAAFDLSITKTLIIGAAVTEATAGVYPSIIKNAGLTQYLGMRVITSGSTVIGGEVGPTNTVSNTTLVAVGATRRTAFIAATPSSQLLVEVPAQAQQVVAHTNTLATATYRLTLGGSAAATNIADFVWLFTIVLNRAYTAADRAAVQAWAKKYHGVVDG